MLLKSLELQGFKTFPDKTTLSFERGVTSVVGPNGSGKSNISDAMRWVLGEQSLRTLRCSKMEDVVFGGTPQRKAMGFAEVTLTIDNSDRGLPFDNDTVAVTRRYYRSGESEYLINKTTVRLKDVNELFMDTGLGRDGYSIIGQGKIDSIVAARSEDRREIFEEAAGISRYRYRKEESERRLGKAEENLVRLRDILSELEDRVEPLRIQAEKAKKFIAFDREKTSLEIGIWLETLTRSEKLLREQEEKIAIAKAQREEIEEELEQVTQLIEDNYRESNRCTVEMDECQSRAAALDEEAMGAQGEAQVLENDASHNRENRVRLEEQLASAHRSREDTQREIAEKRLEIGEKEKAVEESRDKLSAYNDKLEELRRSADEATRKIEEAAQTLARRNAALSEAKIRLSSARSAMEELRLRAGAVEESVKRAKDREAASRQEGEELKAMLQETEEAISAGENAVKGYELRLESRRKRAGEAKERLEKLTLDANEQLRRAKLLEDLERNLEGFTQSVKSVMKEADRGILTGICGPVTRLLTVPGEYAVALETALGAAMQNIVVETDRDAKKAIGLLKQRDWGRATFLPLTTVRGSVLDVGEIEDMPGYVGVASQLCSCEDRFSEIRDFLLGRVAVAEDLDSAAAIAKRTKYRFRVVSLDGQVVNTGGSFTGGSRAKNSGLLSRASEIRSIREKGKVLQEKADKAKEEWKTKEEELSACQAELSAARGELSSLQEERVKIQAESARAIRELETARQELSNLQREKDDSARRLGELEQAASQAEAEAEALSEKAVEGEEESKRLTGNRAEILDRCEDISQTIQEIRLREFSAQKDRDSLLAAVEELLRRQEDSGSLSKQLEEDILSLDEKHRELLKAAKAKRDDSQALRSQAEAQRQKGKETGKKREALEKEAGELRTRERETTARREKAGEELSRLNERSENMQKEYSSILSRLWDDYELTRREAEEQAVPVEDLPAAQRRLQELKNSIRALGVVNAGAVEEYEEVSKRYAFLRDQVEDAEKSKAELLSLIDQLTVQMKQQFTQRFAEINRNFASIFRELFGGGAAELSFTDPEDVLHSGIEIKVQPPGKIVSHIESLSGGEKALVAISIYFGIMRVNPPPFCVLDEIEAALDDVNVARYAQYLRRMSGNSQFIAITHRRGTMEGSDMLYGVTMQDQGISKLLALKTEEAAEFGA